jgi:hypothetical protein
VKKHSGEIDRSADGIRVNIYDIGASSDNVNSYIMQTRDKPRKVSLVRQDSRTL